MRLHHVSGHCQSSRRRPKAWTVRSPWQAKQSLNHLQRWPLADAFGSRVCLSRLARPSKQSIEICFECQLEQICRSCLLELVKLIWPLVLNFQNEWNYQVCQHRHTWSYMATKLQQCLVDFAPADIKWCFAWVWSLQRWEMPKMTSWPYMFITRRQQPSWWHCRATSIPVHVLSKFAPDLNW